MNNANKICLFWSIAPAVPIDLLLRISLFSEMIHLVFFDKKRHVFNSRAQHVTFKWERLTLIPIHVLLYQNVWKLCKILYANKLKHVFSTLLFLGFV